MQNKVQILDSKHMNCKTKKTRVIYVYYYYAIPFCIFTQYRTRLTHHYSISFLLLSLIEITTYSVCCLCPWHHSQMHIAPHVTSPLPTPLHVDIQ